MNALFAVAGPGRWSINGPEGGSVHALAFDPLNPNIMYAGLVSGIYKSWDGGGKWYLAGLWNTAIESFAFDPANSATMYASGQGGVFRSDDHGATWRRLDFNHSLRKVLFAGSALYVVDTSNGVYRSTDGGANWTAVNNGLPSSGRDYLDLAVSPKSPSTLFLAARRSANGGTNGGLFRTTDGGANWTKMTSGLTDPDYYIAAVDPVDANVVSCGSGNHVFRSYDGGQNWAALTTLPSLVYSAGFAFDPTNHLTMVTVGNSLVFRSTTQGNSWTTTPLPMAPVLLVGHPTKPSTLFLATATHGVLRSDDAFQTWQTSNSGLIGNYGADIVVDASDSATAYAAAANAVMVTNDRGRTWRSIYTAAPAGCLASPRQTPKTVYVAPLNGGVVKSSDGGATFAPFGGGIADPVWAMAVDPQDDATLYAYLPTKGAVYRCLHGGAWLPLSTFLPQGVPINRFAIDPATTTTIYAATTNGLYRSTDGGVNWVNLAGLATRSVADVVVDPSAPQNVHAVASKELWKSGDRGATWTQISASPIPSATVTDVAVNPKSSNTIVAATFGGMYRTTDGGSTWRPFSDGLRELWITRLVGDATGTQFYAGTMYGGVASYHATSIVLPAAASLHGVNGAFFHSDVAVVNSSMTDSRTVTATYRCYSGSCGNAVQSFTLAPGEMRLFEDIVTTLFAAPESGGPIELDADGHIVVTSRLYTPSKPSPTYGQFIPGLTIEDGFRSAATPSLSYSTNLGTGFRSNSGIFNATDHTRNVTVKIFDTAGRQLGTQTKQLGARQTWQLNNVFAALGVGANMSNAYCTYAADDDGPLYAYASVLDNQSQDPIFVPGCEMNVTGAVQTITLPAVASLHGANNAFFHSDVAVLNTGSIPADVTATYRCFSGACGTAVKKFTVLVGQEAVFDDIVASLFGAPEGGGAVELDVIGSAAITSRLYTPSKPAPTVGQFIHGMNADHAGPRTILAGLSFSADSSRGFRTNAGAFNSSDVAHNVSFTLVSTSGDVLGTITRPIGARQAIQINDLFRAAGVTTDVAAAYCIVQSDAGAPLFTYASVLDNQSQDPVFIAGEIDPTVD